MSRVPNNFQKKYTEAQIRKCVLATSKIHNISVNDVHEAIAEVHEIKMLESTTLYKLTPPKGIELSDEFLPKEVRDIILDSIEDDGTYKAILGVSKSVHKKQIQHRGKHFNQLWTLINKYSKDWMEEGWPEGRKKWDLFAILKNPNTSEQKLKEITLKKLVPKIKKHENIQIYNKYILKNPNIKDIDFFKKYASLYDWSNVLKTSPFVFDIIATNPKFRWDGGELSQNPHLTIKFIKEHPKIHWDMHNISLNITLRDIDDNPDLDWDYEGLSANPNVTPEYIEKHIDKAWNWDLYSSNPHLTMEFVDRHLNKEWNWEKVSSNPGISLQDIEKRLKDNNYNWDLWYGLSENPNISIQFVKKHIDGIGELQLEWDKLSRNPGISMEDIEANMDLPWVWRFVYSNPNFTVDHADKYKDLDIAHFYQMFSANSNLTADYVSKNINQRWWWDKISHNKFEKDPNYKRPRFIYG